MYYRPEINNDFSLVELVIKKKKKNYRTALQLLLDGPCKKKLMEWKKKKMHTNTHLPSHTHTEYTNHKSNFHTVIMSGLMNPKQVELQNRKGY